MKKSKKEKLSYKYVLAIRYKTRQEQIFGCKDLDALMYATLGVIADKKVKDWSACEYSVAKKSGLTKFIDYVCLGPAKTT